MARSRSRFCREISTPASALANSASAGRGSSWKSGSPGLTTSLTCTKTLAINPGSGAAIRILRLAASTVPGAARPRGNGLTGGASSGTSDGAGCDEAMTAHRASGIPSKAAPIVTHLNIARYSPRDGPTDLPSGPGRPLSAVVQQLRLPDAEEHFRSRRAEPAVIDEIDDVGESQDAHVVGDDQHGPQPPPLVPISAGRQDQVHHGLAGLGIEVSSRLVADQQPG